MDLSTKKKTGTPDTETPKPSTSMLGVAKQNHPMLLIQQGESLPTVSFVHKVDDDPKQVQIPMQTQGEYVYEECVSPTIRLTNTRMCFTKLRLLMENMIPKDYFHTESQQVQRELKEHQEALKPLVKKMDHILERIHAQLYASALNSGMTYESMLEKVKVQPNDGEGESAAKPSPDVLVPDFTKGGKSKKK